MRVLTLAREPWDPTKVGLVTPHHNKKVFFKLTAPLRLEAIDYKQGRSGKLIKQGGRIQMITNERVMN